MRTYFWKYFYSNPFKNIILFSIITCSSSLNAQLISGVVIDNTLTIAGSKFYSCFAKAWYLTRHKNRTNLVVSETISPRYGNKVKISTQDETLFEVALSARNVGNGEQCEKAKQAIPTKLTMINLRSSQVQARYSLFQQGLTGK